MKATTTATLTILALTALAGCTQQVKEPVIPTAPTALSERCVFTPAEQRNAKGVDLGDRINQNDIRQCDDLVARLKTGIIDANAALVEKQK